MSELFNENSISSEVKPEAKKNARIKPTGFTHLLNELFSPLSLSDFLDSYLAKKLFLMNCAGTPKKPIASVYSHQKLKYAIEVGEIDFKHIKLITSSGVFCKESFENKGLKKFSLAKCLLRFIQHEGGTLVLDKVYQHSLETQELIIGFQEVLGIRIGANAYFTGKNAQAYPLHWDTHDVLVLQVCGEKFWTVYEPKVDMPLEDIHYCTKYDLSALNVKLETNLQAGDLLYLPRGYPHKASTGKSNSIHVSFGLYAHNWYNYLKTITNQALISCQSDARFRQDCHFHLAKREPRLDSSDDILRDFIDVIKTKAKLQ